MISIDIVVSFHEISFIQIIAHFLKAGFKFLEWDVTRSILIIFLESGLDYLILKLFDQLDELLNVFRNCEIDFQKIWTDLCLFIKNQRQQIHRNFYRVSYLLVD
jgi:hypothetical protein